MFFEVFEKLCKERGITPTRASQEIGFSKGSVSYWRKNYNNGVDAKPDSKTAALIADFFGVSVDYLLGRTNDPNDSAKEPSTESAGPVSDEQIKFALFGGAGEITDAMYEEVRNFAAFVMRREADKKKKE